MSRTRFLILQCTHPDCRFRYPELDDSSNDIRCPKCGETASLDVRPFANLPPRRQVKLENRRSVVGVLDSIRSAYNVGSMIRTASGAGLTNLYLCGITPSPDNPRVAKTSLGAESSVKWSHHNNALDLAHKLLDGGYSLIALEGGERSNVFMEGMGIRDDSRIAVVVGNELCGVDPGLLELCDHIMALPMQGEKTSLNVSVAFGIGAYLVRYASWPKHQED